MKTMAEDTPLPDPETHAHGPRAMGRWAVPIAALLLGIGLNFGPLLKIGMHQIAGGLGDTRLVHFSLEHGHRSMLGVEGHPPFWDPPIFYPARGTAAFTDTVLSLLPFYSPWRLLGAPPESAFQCWWMSIFTLNFVAFYVYLRRIFGLSRWAASAGAYLFTFGSSRLVDIGHPQMMPWFYVIAALYALHRLWQAIERGDRPFAPWLAMLCGALALQAYAAVYPLFFFALGVACFALPAGIWGLVRRGSRRRIVERTRQCLKRPADRRGAAWLAIAALALLAVVPLAQHYLDTRQSRGERPWNGIKPRIPRFSSWFLMGHGNRLYGDRSEAKAKSRPGWPARSPHHSNGLGYATLAAVALGFVVAAGRRRQALPALIGGAVLVALTTVYPDGSTPWHWIYEHVPGAGAIRAVGRIGMMLLIPAGLGLGLLVERLVGHRRLRWSLPLLFALVVAEQAHALPSFYGRAVYDRTNRLAAEIPDDCSSFFLSPVIPGRGRAIQEDAMWMALASGVPTINGRYGNHHSGWHLVEIASRKGLPAKEIAGRLDLWIEAQGMDRDTVCWLEVGPDGMARRDLPVRRYADPR